ncbi:RNA-processing protein [archaeon]|nr:RNA-processing protein [archaeon]
MEDIQVTETLKIPKERIRMLIGKNGKVRRMFEKRSGLILRIDSDEGEVMIKGESTKVYDFKNVIIAIGRGFAPDTAFKLFEEEYGIEVLDISDYSGKSKKRLKVLKGRIVGTQGRARKNIEVMTGCFISVYGKTIAIIGLVDNSEIARHAVEKLLAGSMHGKVYAWLERRKRIAGRDEKR